VKGGVEAAGVAQKEEKAAKVAQTAAQGTKAVKSTAKVARQIEGLEKGVKTAKAVESIEKGAARATKVEQVAQQTERVEYTTKVGNAEEVAPQGAEVRKGSQLKTRPVCSGEKGGAKGFSAARSKELFNFTETILKHMNNPKRSLPVSILKNTIKNSKGLLDPRGTKALMYYVRITRNRKKYNLEVLYDKATNTIMHFKYSRDAMGPLKEIPK
jgi:hypothetical protein